MTTGSLSDVGLLDLRGWSGGEPPAMVGRVIVLDNAAFLLDHWDVYLSLVGDRQVTGVICLAVGEAAVAPEGNGARDPVVLRIPGVLPNGGGVVLWIGDVHGVMWGSARDQPRPIGSGRRISLDQLLLALQVPEVFDAVRHQVRELPGRAANPGLVLFSGATSPDELAEARASAVRELTTVWPEQPMPVDLRESIARLGVDPRQPAGAVLMPSSPVDIARKQANQQLGEADQLTRALGSPRLLIGSDHSRPSLASAVAGAGQAAEQYRNALGELLYRIDGQLRRGDTSVARVVEMGVQQPFPLSPPAVAEGLRAAVHGRLSQEPSLPQLGTQLRREATAKQPQGCPNELEQLRLMGPLQREFPASRRWPIPVIALPLVALTCAVVAFAAPSGPLAWVLGAAVALAWALPGWLLLAHWPRPQGERGLDGAAPAFVVYFLIGLLGVAGGVAATRVVGSLSQSSLTRQVLIAVAVVVVVVVVVLSWRRSAKRLVNALALPALSAAVQQMSDLAHGVVSREWQPSERNRVVARALNEAADGLLEISQAVQHASTRQPAQPHPAPPDDSEIVPGGIPRALPAELLAVVREDLVSLSASALAPAWQAMELGRRTDTGTYTRRTQRLLAEYDAHILRAGLMSLPTPETDSGLRSQLLVRMWSESPAAREAVRVRGADDMVQLCSGHQLGDLSSYGEPSMVRFAPEPVRPILEPDHSHRGDGPQSLQVVWVNSAELAGALRLLPLRSAAMCTEQGGGFS
ncbi:MAG: hypothetical protein ACRDTA_16575 [Pseudonocardiaceae bacterium]